MKTSLLAQAALLGSVAAIPLDARNAVCTSVVLLSPDFDLGPTHTEYSSTTTTTETVDCGQCYAVVPSYLPLGVPPVALINATTTAATPSTATTYVCSNPTPRPVPIRVEQRATHDLWVAPPLETVTAYPPGMPSPGCTLTTQVDPVVPDSTSTIYAAGTTTTSQEVECGGCAMIWSTGVINFFVAVTNTATITGETSTKTDLVCATPA